MVYVGYTTGAISGIFFSVGKKCSSLNALLGDTAEAYYWSGFIAADGSIEPRGRLKLYIKDHEHVRRFGSFIGWNGKFGSHLNCIGISVMNSVVVRSFSKKFGLVPRKTYNPPRGIPSNDPDLRFSYAVGFVDGDGCIIHQSGGRRDAFLRIKCHKSWSRFLEKVGRCLSGKKTTAQDCSGYAGISICDSVILKRIKRRVLKLGLPVLERKWKTIDLDYVGRQEFGRSRAVQVRKLLSLGMAKTDIASRLGIAKSSVTQIINRNDIRAYKGRMQGR